MSDVFSEFHDTICQGSHFIYSGHFEDSVNFYKKIGFIQIHRENNFLCVLRMKHIYVEIWDNNKRFPTTETSNTNEDCLNSSLMIYVNNKENLLPILEHIKHQTIATNEEGLKDLGHPLGHNFFIIDPDKNRITFATGPVWSYPFYYETQCRDRIKELSKEEEKENKPQPKETLADNVIYPDFSDGD